MKVDWKKALRAVLTAAGIILFVGGPLLFVFVFARLGAVPLYITRVIPVIGTTLVLALILVSSGYLTQQWVRRVWVLFLCVLLGSAAYAGWGAYHDSIPTVDDRSLLLWEYQPFEEENKLVSLEEKATLQFDTPYALKLDGATALYPVYAAFVQAVYPDRWQDTGIEIDYNPYRSTVECSGTTNAYERLISGEVNMIFAAGPSQAQLEMATKAGKELHLTPIGREAFVFFVNSRNPVESLTVEQIQGIYTGEITNWKVVGGKNQPLRPFQRDENSGSQTALQSLMAGLPLMEPEEEDRVEGMGDIIRSVASYRNYKNAIGFSFRYYATEMVQNGDIRLLALNGVEPTKETIRDNSYPIASEFYAVTASRIGEEAPQTTNQTMEAFLGWILSEQGQRLIEETGYVSLNG